MSNSLIKRGKSHFINVCFALKAEGRNMQTKNYFAVDSETTGLDCKVDEILNLCVVPLDHDFRINQVEQPLNLWIKPTKPPKDNWPQFMNRNYAYATKYGVERSEAPMAFANFIRKLNLNGDKIIPVGHNYQFDIGFIKQIVSNYEDFFDYHYNDSMNLAEAINAAARLVQKEAVFPSTSLRTVAARLGVQVDRDLEHTGLGDCKTTAEVYRRLLLYIK